MGFSRKEYMKKYSKKWYRKNRDQHLAHIETARQERKDMIAKYKQETGCAKCGITDHRVLEFHHVDPMGKHRRVNELIKGNLERLWEEIDKCVVICANCHKILHWEERNEKI